MKAIGKPLPLPAIRLACFAAARLAAVAIVASAAVVAPAAAQTALTAAADGRGAPGGRAVISIRAGTPVTVGAANAGNVLVTVEGWVDGSRLAGKVDSFPASADAKATLRVRASASASAAILAELQPRAGVYPVAKSGSWTRVRRSAWIPATALSGTPAAAADAPPPAADAAPVPPGAMAVSAPTKLLTAPGASAVGELVAGAIVTPIAHDHGFAKVQIEGWLPEHSLTPADTALGSRLTAADLRADPEGTRGKAVQWEVQILSLQTADPLRPELARDEPYLLARGPGDENALLYLAVPPSLLGQAKALAPLSHVLITARVRSGRSEPVGTPILDLKSISRR